MIEFPFLTFGMFNNWCHQIIPSDFENIQLHSKKYQQFFSISINIMWKCILDILSYMSYSVPANMCCIPLPIFISPESTNPVVYNTLMIYLFLLLHSSKTLPLRNPLEACVKTSSLLLSLSASLRSVYSYFSTEDGV